MSLSTTSAAAPLILISTVLLLSVTITSAVDITGILEQMPEFSEFNNLLTKTQVANEINRRRTITVLALSNDHIGEISGKPEDVQKKILSNHVVLDYYDAAKLTELEVNKTGVLTTLFQASGSAGEQQGFLHVIHNKDDSVLFGSAVKGALMDSKLEESVASQPYDISVLSISRPIIAPGIDGVRPVSSPPPSTPATPAAPNTPAAPAPAAVKVPPPAQSPAEKKPADAPAANKVSPPAEAPKKPADAPAADSDAPVSAAADAPAAPTPGSQPADADDNQSPANAAGKQLVSGVSLGLIVAFASTFLAVL